MGGAAGRWMTPPQGRVDRWSTARCDQAKNPALHAVVDQRSTLPPSPGASVTAADMLKFCEALRSGKLVWLRLRRAGAGQSAPVRARGWGAGVEQRHRGAARAGLRGHRPGQRGSGCGRQRGQLHRTAFAAVMQATSRTGCRVDRWSTIARSAGFQRVARDSRPTVDSTPPLSAALAPSSSSGALPRPPDRPCGRRACWTSARSSCAWP